MLCVNISSIFLRLALHDTIQMLTAPGSFLTFGFREENLLLVWGLGLPCQSSTYASLTHNYHNSTTTAWMQQFPMAEERANKIPIAPLQTTAYTAKQPKKRIRKTERNMGKKRESDRARNKTRVNIGMAFQPWRELMELKGMKSDSQMALFLLDRYIFLFIQSMFQ